MVEVVTIPVSFFELAVDYEQPALNLLTDRGLVMQAIFNALRRWDAKLDDIEIMTAGKHSEQGVMFRIPPKRASFFFGAEFCRFSRDGVDWSSAEETTTMLEAAISTLLKVSGVATLKLRATIGIHIQPRTKTFMEILSPFMAPQLAGLEHAPLFTMAIVAKWEKRKVTLDGSVAVANGVFIKIEREFESATSYTDMALRLKEDEDHVLQVLGVEEDRA